MEGIYVYANIEIDKLYSGVHRPQSWIDEHPLFVKLIDKLKKSIEKEGLRHPLCAVNLKDDGTYEVTTGNRRFIALREIKAKEAPCVVACKPGQKFIPQGKVLSTEREIIEKYGGSVKNICLNPNIFFVAPSDVDGWDENKVFKK